MESNEKTFTSEANFHLAGIIPVAGRRLDYDLPFPDVLLPISRDYTLLESAVVECAYAGCDTIWIICSFWCVISLFVFLFTFIFKLIVFV